jgi:hypothetical protein
MDGEVRRCLLDAENGFEAGDTKNMGKLAEKSRKRFRSKRMSPTPPRGAKVFVRSVD